MKKYIILYLALLISPAVATAQSTSILTVLHGNIKKADLYFDRNAYRNALTLYLHAHDQEPKNVYIIDRIAECYFKLHDPISAEKWYAKIADNPYVHRNRFVKFEYAEVLSLNGKYDESLFWFDRYLRENPDDEITKDKIAFLKRINEHMKDSLRFIVTDVPFNSDHSDYGATYFHDGVAFSSSRDLDWYVKHAPSDAVSADESALNMFYVPGVIKGEFGEVEELHKEHIKSVLHEGPMTFYANDTKAVYTITNMENGKPLYDARGKANLQLFFADINTTESLTNIKPFPYNSPKFSLAHPSISKDGQVLYFSSTTTGGQGGSDIYVSRLVNGKWSQPENLGSDINSQGDESFPFLANDSTLYFASNGHGSMGGLDVMASRKVNGKFGKPVYFGAPLNSRFDDFSLVTDSSGRTGFFSSNRPGGAGMDDIYTFVATRFYVSGKVVTYFDKNEIVPEATVTAIDLATGQVIATTVADKKGVYRMMLPFDKAFKFEVEKQGYLQLEPERYSSYDKSITDDAFNVTLFKQNLSSIGTIYSNELQKPLTGVTATIHDLTKGTVDSVLVDTTEYSLPLWPNRQYRIVFTKDEYLPEEITLDTKGLLKGGRIKNDILMMQESIANTVIYFGYNQSNLTDATIKQLKPLVNVLKRFPKSTLNIGAHADPRGRPEYNLELSLKRAKNTLNYFVSNGIAVSRITAVGFGEAIRITRCTDGENCSEVEYDAERRAEIKVQQRNKYQPK